MSATVPGGVPLAATDETWVPGDPLHPRGQYTGYIFNFRWDNDGPQCMCSDAASWPEPRRHHDLDRPPEGTVDLRTFSQAVGS